MADTAATVRAKLLIPHHSQTQIVVSVSYSLKLQRESTALTHLETSCVQQPD